MQSRDDSVFYGMVGNPKIKLKQNMTVHEKNILSAESVHMQTSELSTVEEARLTLNYMHIMMLIT